MDIIRTFRGKASRKSIKRLARLDCFTLGKSDRTIFMVVGFTDTALQALVLGEKNLFPQAFGFKEYPWVFEVKVSLTAELPEAAK